ncbi:MAG: hypothetical protein V4759_11425 [Pseudomonadota bacterium]
MLLLQRLIEGEAVTISDLNLVPHDQPLSDRAGVALHQLQHWLADADIRQKDPNYATNSRQELSQILGDLRKEIDRSL